MSSPDRQELLRNAVAFLSDPKVRNILLDMNKHSLPLLVVPGISPYTETPVSRSQGLESCRD